MERVGGRWEKMEGHFSTGQSPQRVVVPMEEEEEKVSNRSSSYAVLTFTLNEMGSH